MHVTSAGTISVAVGEREAVEASLARAPGKAHVGVYVKNGRVTLEDAVVELYP